MKLKFPHFHRVNSARLFFSLEMILLWGGLAALIAINVMALQKIRPAHWDKLMMLFAAPFSVPRSLDLASFLWKMGQKDEARRLVIAAQSGEVLGAWEQADRKLAEQYAFWQSVAAAHPDYRDAFISLAALSYQLGNLEDARASLERAQALDPNSPTVQAFTSVLDKSYY
ncbi:tetratricopeptide repeat protein [Candidatus Gottesmanbacteria bacterium]|nr:tetratricopeptide repeat protein [Candidatus Gottesmanbacteria bacterium]